MACRGLGTYRRPYFDVACLQGLLRRFFIEPSTARGDHRRQSPVPANACCTKGRSDKLSTGTLLDVHTAYSNLWCQFAAVGCNATRRSFETSSIKCEHDARMSDRRRLGRSRPRKTGISEECIRLPIYEHPLHSSGESWRAAWPRRPDMRRCRWVFPWPQLSQFQSAHLGCSTQPRSSIPARSGLPLPLLPPGDVSRALEREPSVPITPLSVSLRRAGHPA